MPTSGLMRVERFNKCSFSILASSRVIFCRTSAGNWGSFAGGENNSHPFGRSGFLPQEHADLVSRNTLLQEPQKGPLRPAMEVLSKLYHTYSAVGFIARDRDKATPRAPLDGHLRH
jgi:hypothetical protein